MTQASTPVTWTPDEHASLNDTAGPHCRCGWIPRSSDPYRAAVSVNQHIGAARRKQRAGA